VRTYCAAQPAAPRAVSPKVDLKWTEPGSAEPNLVVVPRDVVDVRLE
jgi:hypothetical protein